MIGKVWILKKILLKWRKGVIDERMNDTLDVDLMMPSEFYKRLQMTQTIYKYI